MNTTADRSHRRDKARRLTLPSLVVVYGGARRLVDRWPHMFDWSNGSVDRVVTLERDPMRLAEILTHRPSEDCATTILLEATGFEDVLSVPASARRGLAVVDIDELPAAALSTLFDPDPGVLDCLGHRIEGAAMGLWRDARVCESYAQTLIHWLDRHSEKVRAPRGPLDLDDFSYRETRDHLPILAHVGFPLLWMALPRDAGGDDVRPAGVLAGRAPADMVVRLGGADTKVSDLPPDAWQARALAHSIDLPAPWQHALATRHRLAAASVSKLRPADAEIWRSTWYDLSLVFRKGEDSRLLMMVETSHRMAGDLEITLQIVEPQNGSILSTDSAVLAPTARAGWRNAHLRIAPRGGLLHDGDARLRVLANGSAVPLVAH